MALSTYDEMSFDARDTADAEAATVAQALAWGLEQAATWDALIDLMDEDPETLVLLRAFPEDAVMTLPIHRTEAGWPRCATCEGGGCYDCTDPA